MRKGVKYFNNPSALVIKLFHKVAAILPDKIYIRIQYRLYTGKILNLDNPQRFTEKIQWLKLNNRRPEYTSLVDKITVKDYVAAKLGKEYIIPTLGVWNNADKIDYSVLPDQFVLKTNHSGGNSGVVICKNKSQFDKTSAKRRLNKSLKRDDIYKSFREYPYKNIERRIFAEAYMQNENDTELVDYKFYCFNGRAEYCQVIANRRTKETIDFFDRDWTHMPFYGLNPKCGPAAKPAAKPAAYDEMLRIADVLSSEIPFLRVDLYYINGNVYFGELTFFPASGLGRFTPDEWDYKLGEILKLDNITVISD